jgi:hypothetical protein
MARSNTNYHLVNKKPQKRKYSCGKVLSVLKHGVLMIVRKATYIYKYPPLFLEGI